MPASSAVVVTFWSTSPEIQKPAWGAGLASGLTGETQSVAGLRFPENQTGSQAVIFR